MPNTPRRREHFRELFRYKKAGRTRVYNLAVLDEAHAELWVVSGQHGEKSRRLASLRADDELAVFLEEMQRELRSGGWVQV